MQVRLLMLGQAISAAALAMPGLRPGRVCGSAMKILIVSPWYPWPPFDGGRIRILETLRYLSRHHQVTLLATVMSAEEADDGGRLREICQHVETSVLSPRAWPVARRLAKGLLGRMPVVQNFYHDPRLAERLRRLTSRRYYDVIQIEFSYAASYVRAVDLSCGAKTVLSMHNVESLRFGREGNLGLRLDRRFAAAWDRAFHGLWEQQAIRTFDGIVSVSEPERAWVLARVPEAVVELIPNGVDTDHFRPQAPPDPGAPPRLVFTGAMHYPPNVDAALWFTEQIWPRLRRLVPDLCFEIVGRDPDPRVVALGRTPGVVVTGEVADVRPYIASARCVVVPLRAGGGTRLKNSRGHGHGTAGGLDRVRRRGTYDHAGAQHPDRRRRRGLRSPCARSAGVG